MAQLDYNYIAQLVERTLVGDSDAFAELYAATYRKQYQFAVSYMKDEYLAQDALQETYITALKNLKSLKDPKLFVAWLNQINFRTCYNMSVKQAGYTSRTTELSEDTAAENPASNPENRTVQIDQKEYILRQVMALPYSESQIIFLHYYENMKINDIAAMLELSRSTVMRYLANGKNRLARSLAY